jgi:hypothetical protein
MSPLTIDRRRFLQLTAGVGLVSAVPSLRSPALGRGRVPDTGVWLAGDFHVHTTYSHDVWGGPGDDNTGQDEFYTLGWTPAEQIAIAETRGLNFVALTDHNRVDALRDPGYASTQLTLVPGYEHSLSGGHAGVFVPGIDLLPDVIRNDDGSTGFGDDASLQRFVDLVHERGGVTVLNHPKDSGGWQRPIAASLGFDAIEAWNGRWQQRADVLPAAWTNNYEAVPWYEDNFLRDHHRRVGIAGGSDNHWRSVTALAGVGQPTTWVYAADRSAGAVIDGIRSGRTFVSQEPPLHGGPRLFLTAREDWRRGNEAMVGGRVGALGPLEVTVTVENGTGQRLRLISTGQVVDERLVPLPAATHRTRVVLPPGGWLRAELLFDAGYAMTAITSPIFTGPRPAPSSARTEPTTGPPVTYASPPTTLPEIACDC